MALMSSEIKHDYDLVRSFNAKTRIIFIAGFLGAGKTTLLAELIQSREDMSDTVIMINEFGKIGIDSYLIEKEWDQVMELNSGCICCTLLSDLTKMIKDTINKFKPKWIVVEASGVADPQNLLSALDQKEISMQVLLHGIISVIDAKCWPMRELFGNVFLSQVTTASLIVLNKCDLIEDATSSLYLQEIKKVNRQAVVVPAVNCRIDHSLIWCEQPMSHTQGVADIGFLGPNSRKTTGQSFCATEISHVKQKASRTYQTVSFNTSQYMDKKRFKELLKNLPLEVFRIKGIICFPSGSLLINWVEGRSNWRLWQGNPDTNIVIIGWDLDQSKILSALRECRIRPA